MAQILGKVNMIIGTVIISCNASTVGLTYAAEEGVMGARLVNPDLEYIQSPDWSRDLIIKESGTPGTWSDMHGWGKFIGGESASFLLTQGLSGIRWGGNTFSSDLLRRFPSVVMVLRDNHCIDDSLPQRKFYYSARFNRSFDFTSNNIFDYMIELER